MHMSLQHGLAGYTVQLDYKVTDRQMIVRSNQSSSAFFSALIGLITTFLYSQGVTVNLSCFVALIYFISVKNYI